MFDYSIFTASRAIKNGDFILLHDLTVIVEGCAFAAAAGLVYGLFGGGSGLFLMPAFYFLLKYFPVAQGQGMQVAIATTATTSAVLGLFALRVQWQRKNIDFTLVKRLFWGVLTGTILAIILLNLLPSGLLKHLFGIVVMLVALWMFLYKQHLDDKKWSLSFLMNYLATSLIGLLWFLLGVAVFTVPYLVKSGVEIRRAVGCATVVSTLFSAIAAVLLMITGYFHIGYSGTHIGFLNVPLFLIALIPSAIASYLGARLSVKLSQEKLKLFYSCLVFVVGFVMVV